MEGRLFFSFRYAWSRFEVIVDPDPGTVITSEEPLLLGSDSTSWRTHYGFGGGSEFLFRPESSRRLELGASLGIGARFTDAYNPDGSPRTFRSLHVFGGVSVGWLFF